MYNIIPFWMIFIFGPGSNILHTYSPNLSLIPYSAMQSSLSRDVPLMMMHVLYKESNVLTDANVPLMYTQRDSGLYHV